MAVHISTFDTTPWDDLSQNQQESPVGRFKVSAASLDLTDETHQLHAEPTFIANQTNTVVPLTSHVRKANPRRSPEDAARRLHRRGCPIIGSAMAACSAGWRPSPSPARRAPSSSSSCVAGCATRTSPSQEQARTLLLGALPVTVLCGGYYFVPAIRKAPWTLVMPQLP